MIILTAAAHGGADPGASNPFDPTHPEKHINLAIESRLAELAALNGHQVYRMRTGDESWALSDLAPTANRVGAQAVFEIHCNSAGRVSTTRGAYAIALPGAPGWEVGRLIMRHLQQATGIPNLGVQDHLWDRGRLIFTPDITRFRELADRVHLTTENGFITNPDDYQVLSSPNGQLMIAWSHLAGLHEYYGLPAPRLPQPPPAPSLAWILPLILGLGLIGFYLFAESQAGARP